MTYSHAKGLTPDKLAAAVNAMMAEGWQPHGSPQWDFNGNKWIQAMVRTEQKNGDAVQLREPRRK